jgi:HSP20 family molecular chaperone IbpA
MAEKKELETRGDSEIEQTRSGPVFTPAVDIFETEDMISVLADMPGVLADDLIIDLRENVLTLTGAVAAPEGDKEEEVLREFAVGGTYYRRFTLSDTIDQPKIMASLKDGVLRLDLPKVEAVKPRKIAVKTT